MEWFLENPLPKLYWLVLLTNLDATITKNIFMPDTNSLSCICHEFVPEFVPYKNRLYLTCKASDKVCQLPAQGQWFHPDNLASSTSKTDHCFMPEILLKWHYTPIKQTNQITTIIINSVKQVTFKHKHKDIHWSL